MPIVKKSIKYMTYITLFLSFFVSYLYTSHAMASRVVVNPSMHISYTDVGHGKPLVLIHAYPLDQQLWKPQLDNLSSHFRVITLDLWGFGQSSPASGKIASMEEYADEVKQLLDKLHIKKAIIGGESMGGYVSLAFLKRYPDRVDGLVLSDTNSISLNPQERASYMKTADDILANGSASFIRDFLPKAVSPDASQQIKDYLLNIMNQQTPTAMAAAFRGIAVRSDTSRVLSETTLPILIITGEKDQVLPPQQSEDMHKLAKNSRLVIIPEAGHLPSLEKPKQWNQAVIEMFYTKK